MDWWKLVCYKRLIVYFFKTSLSDMATRNPVHLVTKGGLPILKESGTNIHISQMLSRWKMLLPVCLMAAISDLICAPNMVWKTLTTFTIYSKHVRGCYLNFLIFTPLGREMGGCVGFYVVICFQRFHHFQLQCTMCGLIPPNMKYDYQKALYDTRKTVERHPTALTTMIIECSYHGWKNFFQRLEEKKRIRENK